MLNLHATFTKGTVEFRLFQFDKPSNGKLNGLHAGQLKSYIQLCLALSQMAKEVRTASPKPQQNENPKYATVFQLYHLLQQKTHSLKKRNFLNPSRELLQKLKK